MAVSSSDAGLNRSPDIARKPGIAWGAFPYSWVTFAALLVIWQVVVDAFHIPKFLLPSPVMILRDMNATWKELLITTAVTSYETLLGFALSVIVGVPLAVALSASKAFERAFYPLIVATQAVPKVAVAPLLLIWFGYGLRPKIIIVALVTFFPIVINSVVGLKSLSQNMQNLARSMGATAMQVFWRFQLPSALPGVFAGLKVASVLAVIGAVVAEFVGADSGLGYVIMNATADINVPHQFSAIVLLSVIGIVFFALIERIEKFCLPWHISVRRDQIDV